jgi:DNA polymerase-1
MMKVLLLDAYNLIHRARSGFTKGDYPIIYNFFRGVRPLIEKFTPTKVYFVLEGKPKHRMHLSEVYKANRPRQDASFHEQKATIINIVKECFPFESVLHPDFECDDVIGSLVSYHASLSHDCTVVSTDSDFIQLHNVCDVKLYNPVKKSFVDKPDYDYVTWKALRGDKSDNIFGIPGIGDKKATGLVNNPDQLRELLKNPDKMKIFERNVHLIRLVDVRNASGDIVRYPETREWESLRDVFKNMGFFSMTDDKPWTKYVNTFNCIDNNC